MGNFCLELTIHIWIGVFTRNFYFTNFSEAGISYIRVKNKVSKLVNDYNIK